MIPAIERLIAGNEGLVIMGLLFIAAVVANRQ